MIQVLRCSPHLWGNSYYYDLQLMDSGTQTNIMALGKLHMPTPPMGILEHYVLFEPPSTQLAMSIMTQGSS